jgi:hypothetical protein
MAVLEKIKAFIGVPQPTKGVDRIPQLEAAVAAADVVIADAEEGKELALLAVEDDDVGARERLAAAQGELEAARRVKDEVQDALRVARRVADRRASEAAKKARAASWEQAEDLARERVSVADRLGETLRVAGELYAELTRLGLESYSAMPVRSGSPSTYRLSPGDAAAVVGLDLRRVGLPDTAKVSPSMLSQYPSVVEVAASTLEHIKLVRREDES